MRGKAPFSEFAQMLRGGARHEVAAAARIPLIGFGTLDGDGNLAIDGFRHAFAPGEYAVLRLATVADPMASTSATTVGEHGTHTHTVVRPPELAPFDFEAGERLLVLWTHDRTRPVILGALDL